MTPNDWLLAYQYFLERSCDYVEDSMENVYFKCAAESVLKQIPIEVEGLEDFNCPMCGAIVDRGIVYCSECGQRIIFTEDMKIGS